MEYLQLLKLGLKHILNKKIQKLVDVQNKKKQFSDLNLDLNKKLEKVESENELENIESLINNL